MPGRGNAEGGSGVSSTFGCIPTGVQLMITSAMEVARCDQVTIPAADFLGQPRGPLVVTIGDRQVAPRLIRPKAIDRATPPAPRIRTCLSSSGLDSSEPSLPPIPASSESMAAR